MRSVSGRIGRVFKGAKVDAIVIANGENPDANFLYLTGFTSGIFERDILVVFPGREVLFTGSLEYDTAMSQRPKELKVVKLENRRQFLKEFRALLRGKRVGVDPNSLSFVRYEALRKVSMAKSFVDVSGNFSDARSVKDGTEIASIVRANSIIKKAIGGAFESLKAGMTEKQVAARVEYLIREHGGDGTSFSSIVCFGKNAAYPHHMPDNTRLEPNSFVLLDCGAKYNNYCSDVTRTRIFRPKKGSPKYIQMLEMMETVEKAQKLAMEYVKAGTRGGASYDAAKKCIDTAYNGKYKGTFIHGLGHPIGLHVHDVGQGLWGKQRLKEGMVVSNEPGIYIPGFGGVRKEDDILVMKGRPRVL